MRSGGNDAPPVFSDDVPGLGLDSLPDLAFGFQQVIPSLQIHPKLRAVAKVAAQALAS